MDEGLTERPSESKRLVLTSLPHQLQPAAWLGRNPHHRLSEASEHKLGVSEVIQGRKREALALPVGVTPADWWFRVPRGWRCHREFRSEHYACHSPGVTWSCTVGGELKGGRARLGLFVFLSVFEGKFSCHVTLFIVLHRGEEITTTGTNNFTKELY